jgi:alpha-D-ribose 1-methylphosphonate 5-triphosphate diphosphatase PhnM
MTEPVVLEPVILTNARVVTRDGLVDGTVELLGEHIVAVYRGRTTLQGALDLDNDYLLPGTLPGAGSGTRAGGRKGTRADGAADAWPAGRSKASLPPGAARGCSGRLMAAMFTLHPSAAPVARPGALAMISAAPVLAAHPPGGGEIAPGRRADLIRLHVGEGTPIVRGIWCAGRQIL